MTAIEIYEQAPTGKDYILDIKIRNGPLLRAIRMRGFKSAKAFAEATGFGYPTLCAYLALRYVPICKTGWKRSALALAKLLRLPPDSLFPEQHLEHALAKSRGEIEVSREDLCLMLAGPEPSDAEHDLEVAQVHGRLADMLHGLPPRQMKVLEERFGLRTGVEKTFRQLADESGVTPERIRQIERRALRKLRHPGRGGQLVQAGGYGFVAGRKRAYAPAAPCVVTSRKALADERLGRRHKLFAEQMSDTTMVVREHASGRTVCLIKSKNAAACAAIARDGDIEVLQVRDPRHQNEATVGESTITDERAMRRESTTENERTEHHEESI